MRELRYCRRYKTLFGVIGVNNDNTKIEQEQQEDKEVKSRKDQGRDDEKGISNTYLQSDLNRLNVLLID